MRRFIPFLLGAIALFLVAALVLFNNREKRYPEVSFTTLNDAETRWYSAVVMDYRVVVDVEFSTERRRHDITVRNGQVAEAAIVYWENNAWGQPNAIDAEQAALYTIPGLFAMLRQELSMQLREEMRMDVNTDLAYPRYIYLGKVWQEGIPMDESEARFTVSAFEILSP